MCVRSGVLNGDHGLHGWIGLCQIKFLLGFIVCIIGIGSTAIAAPSDLDPAFGNGGKAIWSPNGNTDSVAGSGMAVQPDGKIVMVGGSIVARFNVDGSIDPTFGTNGWTSITFEGTGVNTTSVAVQTDGKIVVGGTASIVLQPVIVRLNPDGSYDTTFSEDGRVIVPFNTQWANMAFLTVLKVANDGKIVFAGMTPTFNNNYQPIIGRLNPDGSLDTTFSGDGRVIDGAGRWDDLIVRPDGSIVLAGYNSTQFATGRSAAKYNNNGNLEWLYYVGQDFQFTTLNAIAAQPDGKIVLVGGSAAFKILAVRLNADGSIDNTFSSTTVTPNGRASAVAVQTDGKILASVGFDSDSYDGFSLVRYNTDGSLDSGFGSGGIKRIRVLNGFERAWNIIIQPDGKILLGGAAYTTATSGARFAMVRYMGDAAVPIRTLFDYDGDGKADVSVFRPSTNRWYELRSSDSQVEETTFGAAGDIPVPADFDGDGRTDEAVFRPSTGTWWYLSSITGTHNAVQFGQAGDIPRPSDFDGDGKADFIVYRPSSSVWYRLGTTGELSINQFGVAEDKPLIGDFDGDGKSDLAVYRPSTGTWWYAASGSAGQFRAVQFGISTDIPAPADYGGDGRTDFAVYRPSTGVWYILNSSNGSVVITQFGVAEDRPVPADYDGDGRADIAVFRPSTGIWYLLRSTSGFGAVQWGVSGDIPTESAFIP